MVESYDNRRKGTPLRKPNVGTPLHKPGEETEEYVDNIDINDIDDDNNVEDFNVAGFDAEQYDDSVNTDDADDDGNVNVHDFHALLDATWGNVEPEPQMSETVADNNEWTEDETDENVEYSVDNDDDFDNVDTIDNDLEDDIDSYGNSDEFDDINDDDTIVDEYDNIADDNTVNINNDTDTVVDTVDSDDDSDDNISTVGSKPNANIDAGLKLITSGTIQEENDDDDSFFGDINIDPFSPWDFGVAKTTPTTPETEETINEPDETETDSTGTQYDDEPAETITTPTEPVKPAVEGVDGVTVPGHGIIEAKTGDAPITRVPVKIGKRGKPLKPKRNNHDYRVRLTDRDKRMLNFMARYRYATYPQLATYCGTSEVALRRRLPRLREQGIISSEKGGPSWLHLWKCTESGMKLTGLDLSIPKVSWGTVTHTLGLVDLGVQFELDNEIVVTEREIRAADTRANFSDRMTYAANLNRNTRDNNRQGPLTSEDGSLYIIPLAGNKMGHIPDMMLVRKPTADGQPQNIAIELEITRKPASAWRNILKAYARAPHIAQVRYYTHKKEIATAIAKIATEEGLINGEVQVKRFDFTVPGLAVND